MDEDRNPCDELLEKFTGSERMKMLEKEVEGKVEMAVLAIIVLVVITLIALSVAAEQIASMTTMAEIGVLGFHQRKGITKVAGKVIGRKKP